MPTSHNLAEVQALLACRLQRLADAFDGPEYDRALEVAYSAVLSVVYFHGLIPVPLAGDVAQRAQDLVDKYVSSRDPLDRALFQFGIEELARQLADAPHDCAAGHVG